MDSIGFQDSATVGTGCRLQPGLRLPAGRAPLVTAAAQQAPMIILPRKESSHLLAAIISMCRCKPARLSLPADVLLLPASDRLVTLTSLRPEEARPRPSRPRLSRRLTSLTYFLATFPLAIVVAAAAHNLHGPACPSQWALQYLDLSDGMHVQVGLAHFLGLSISLPFDQPASPA